MPAAAVIQGGLALFELTGRKGHVGGLSSNEGKTRTIVLEYLFKLEDLSTAEDSRISSVGMKYANIRRNASRRRQLSRSQKLVDQVVLFIS